jgi:3'-phosphoadenosine 5'-phosphosulfate sulfotransferase (PAPS reductase)/FAD synthetase
MSPIERHPFGVLQFSGGKDSLACLTLLKPYWDRIIVLWTNMGDPFPETIAQMTAIKAQVPHFFEVKGNSPAWIKHHGYPTDVLPVANSRLGRTINGHDGVLLAPHLECCYANLWSPLETVTKLTGTELIIRGQRNSESMRGSVRNGDVIDGIEYWLPLEDWSEQQVYDYLRDQGVALPAHYAKTSTSLDCMHCTAWMRDKADTIAWLHDAYPEVSAEVQRRLGLIIEAVEEGLNMIKGARHGV